MKNGLFILVDAMRGDALMVPEARAMMFPNIDKLVRRGFIYPAIANAQSTQFVLPALFTQSYPLDYGGYNNGIRERPRSFVEVLRDAGFRTHLVTTCNQLGLTMGYDRGFDSIRITSDYRTLLQQRIERTLSYEIQLWQSGKKSHQEIVDLVKREFGLLLDALLKDFDSRDKSVWPPALFKINSRVIARCCDEKALLDNETDVVLNKLIRIPAGAYWHFLGERWPDPIRYIWRRLQTAVSWRWRNYSSYRPYLPFVLSHHPVYMHQVVEPLKALFRECENQKWFTYLHVMDAHDCRAFNHPSELLSRMRFLPRWVLARLRGLTNRRYLYDTALMAVDEAIGDIVEALDAMGQGDNTLIAIAADHGLQYAESPRQKLHVSMRTHYEDIEVAMVVANAPAVSAAGGLMDTMGMSATFLDALSVPPHVSFKGKSLLQRGREAVIVEHAGSGNADLAQRDLYFTIVTEAHKLMTVLHGSKLECVALFDRKADPKELENLISSPDESTIKTDMLRHLYTERGDLLRSRGVEI